MRGLFTSPRPRHEGRHSHHHRGTRSRGQFRDRQSAGLPRLHDHPPDGGGDARGAREALGAQRLHLRAARDADPYGVRGSGGGGRGRRPGGLPGFRPRGDQRGHPRLRGSRRPHPDGGQRLWPRAALLRQLSRPLRGRDRLFRSVDRRRRRRSDDRAHAHRLCRDAGLAHLRDDRRAGRGGGGTCRGSRRHHRQYLERGRPVQAVRARRRRLGPGGDKIHRRPFRRDDGHHHDPRGVVAAGAPVRRRSRRQLRAGRRVPGAQGAAHAWP